MLFASFDESKDSSIKVLGGIFLPFDHLASFEASFLKIRLSEHVWGEVKWNSISEPYLDRYIQLLDIFKNNAEATYHGICFRDEDTMYHAAYTLLRTITWKMENSGIKQKDRKLYLIFDENGSLGKNETKKIQEIAIGDPRFKAEIEFCNQTNSKGLGILQITDLITGALRYSINSIVPNKKQELIIEYLEQVNDGIPLSFSAGRIPDLKEYKITHFDPDKQ